jgi:ABC-type transporter MlaC component
MPPVSAPPRHQLSIGPSPTGYTKPLRFDDIFTAAREKALSLLTANRAAVDALTSRLIATDGKQTLDAVDLSDIAAMVVGDDWQQTDAHQDG